MNKRLPAFFCAATLIAGAATSHAQGIPASTTLTNIVVEITHEPPFVFGGNQHLRIHAEWTTSHDAHGIAWIKFKPEPNISEETLSLVLTARGGAKLLRQGEAISEEMLENFEGAAGTHSARFTIYAAADKTRVEDNIAGTLETWEETLDYKEITGFREVFVSGRGIAIALCGIKLSPTYTLFLVK
jgi:hypothetical protein